VAMAPITSKITRLKGARTSATIGARIVVTFETVMQTPIAVSVRTDG